MSRSFLKAKPLSATKNGLAPLSLSPEFVSLLLELRIVLSMVEGNDGGTGKAAMAERLSHGYSLPLL